MIEQGCERNGIGILLCGECIECGDTGGGIGRIEGDFLQAIASILQRECGTQLDGARDVFRLSCKQAIDGAADERLDLLG